MTANLLHLSDKYLMLNTAKIDDLLRCQKEIKDKAIKILEEIENKIEKEILKTKRLPK